LLKTLPLVQRQKFNLSPFTFHLSPVLRAARGASPPVKKQVRGER
jgi:hypothetical protein